MADNITQRRDLTRALSFGEMDRNWDELIELINDIHGADGVNERIDAINKESLGLDQVDNTSDIDKPISTDTQNALDLKADKSTTQTELDKKVDKASNLSDLQSISTARDNLGLGNAATRDVTTSNTDVTSGGVLKVNDFGVGMSGVQLTDFEDVFIPNGLYRWTQSSTNRPSNITEQYGSAIVTGSAEGASANHRGRILIGLNSDKMWFQRSVNEAPWANPVEIYHSGNDSTSGVVPKGGIIMWSGSTSNIPSGWALCNGANGTPDLRGRFVIGAGGSYNPGNTGGGSIPSHSHEKGTLGTNSTGSHSHSGTAASAGNHNHTMASAGNHTHGYASVLVGRGREFDGNGWGVQANRTTTAAGAHTHTIWSAGAHTHSVSTNANGSHSHTISGSTATYGSGSEVIAKYYALCYIMKL